MKESQKTWIVKMLNIKGNITRNECLAAYISRLGAIINILKKEGWVFESKYVNGDYVYKTVKRGK